MLYRHYLTLVALSALATLTAVIPIVQPPCPVRASGSVPEFRTVYPIRSSNFSDSPIMEWDSPVKTYEIVDSSGVANVTMYYTLKRVEGVTFSIKMNFTGGTQFDGNWTCRFPPQLNGTVVIYYAEAINTEGRSVKSDRESYEVNTITRRNYNLSVSLKEIDDEHSRVKVDVAVSGTVPLRFEYSEISIVCEGYLGPSPSSYSSFSAKRLSRYFYQGTLTWNDVAVQGTILAYPNDRYYANLTFHVFAPSGTVSKHAYSNLNRLLWSVEPNSTVSINPDGTFAVNVSFMIERNPEAASPVMYPLYAAILVLGCSVLAYSRSKPDLSIEICIGIFIFLAGFYFSLLSLLPKSVWFTPPQVLVIAVSFESAVLLFVATALTKISSPPVRFLRKPWISFHGIFKALAFNLIGFLTICIIAKKILYDPSGSVFISIIPYIAFPSFSGVAVELLHTAVSTFGSVRKGA